MKFTYAPPRSTKHLRGISDVTNQHKQPYPKLAKEVIRVSDIILEVLDARFIQQTRNYEMERLVRAQDRKLIYVINKADLVDPKQVIKSPQLQQLKPYVLFSCKTALGHRRLREVIKIEVKRLRKHKPTIAESLQEEAKHADPTIPKERLVKLARRAHVGIIGYPNTGKSTLTNILTGHGGAAASKQAGFTKGIQKIRFSKDILILDTPGVYQEEENPAVSLQALKKHTTIGIQTAETVSQPEVVVTTLMKEHAPLLEGFYAINAHGDAEQLLQDLGRKKGFLRKGNLVDLDRTARLILKDWQSGAITRPKEKT